MTIFCNIFNWMCQLVLQWTSFFELLLLSLSLSKVTNINLVFILGVPKAGLEYQRISIDRSKLSEDEAFEHAIDMISSRQMGFRKAADFFQVSKWKLYKTARKRGIYAEIKKHNQAHVSIKHLGENVKQNRNFYNLHCDYLMKLVFRLCQKFRPMCNILPSSEFINRSEKSYRQATRSFFLTSLGSHSSWWVAPVWPVSQESVRDYGVRIADWT